jgi:DNA-binding LacI/PurR family transcriptional regulator
MNSLNLSALYTPSGQLGEEAGNWLIQRMDRMKRAKESEGRRIILMPELILRGSEKFPVNRL